MVKKGCKNRKKAKNFFSGPVFGDAGQPSRRHIDRSRRCMRPAEIIWGSKRRSFLQYPQSRMARAEFICGESILEGGYLI